MSRHPSDNPVKSREQSIAEQYVRFVMSEAVPRAMTLDEVKMASSKDKTIQKAIEFVRTGQWFKIKNITDLEIDIEELQALRSISGELVTYGDTILLRDNRIIIHRLSMSTNLGIWRLTARMRKNFHAESRAMRTIKDKTKVPHAPYLNKSRLPQTETYASHAYNQQLYMQPIRNRVIQQDI
ncbi:unnamed protein product [Mytilus edulis]|uniref:Uncharacterized protein n=1 Tax=Mytilus edulis TaxID=6550 RepID=A0A8S3QAF2_MYTED|nr:unnamed protein product [Mytilus edulis]